MRKLLVLLVAFFMGAMIEHLLKGGENVRAVYVALIVNGRMTIDDVSKNLKDVVMEDLAALGIDGYGNPIVAE